MKEHGRATRQTHLGLSLQRGLTIVDLALSDTVPKRSSESPSPRSSFATGPTLIFKLPQELLVSIIELAVFEVNRSHGCFDCNFRPNAKCAKALSCVCWRISRIAQPMLFHTISFDGTPSTVPPKKSTIRVHLALRQNPSLRRYCRRFSLRVADYQQGPRDWSIAKDLAKWLTRVRCFECYGGFETSN